jgi:hypothetical protein
VGGGDRNDRARLLATLGFVSFLWLPSETGPETGPGIAVAAIRRHVSFLGADEVEGRAPGCEGADKATRYTAADLQRPGLRPLGEDAGFFQPVPLHASSPDPGNELFLVP